MTKAELVDRVMKAFPHLGASGARRAVDAILIAIETGLADFGVFTRRSHPPRPRRNPRTGEELAPTGDARIQFAAGKGLSARVNPR